LGCKSWDSLCEQCGETTHNCPGHTGHMELPIPCFHVGAMSTLLKILNLVCFYCQRLRITSHMCEKVLQLPSEKRLNTLLKYTRFFRACECGKSYIKWTTESGHDNIIRGVVTLSKTDFQLYQSNPSWKPISFGPFEIQKLLEDISKNEQMMHIMGLGQYNLPKARMFSALAVPALTTRPNSTFPTKNGSKQYPNDWTKMLKNVLQSKLLLEMKLQQSKDPIILSQYLYKGFIHPDFKVCFQKESLTSEERKQLNIQQRQQYRAQLQLINQKLSKCKLSNEASCGNVTNQCAWRNLQNQISAFHFEKYRKLIPKNAQYGKTPNSVDTKFKKTSKSKQSSRMQGFIVAWRKYHYARLVLEGCTWIHPTYCGLPQSTCMGLTINVPVSSFNMNQAHKWILNGPHHYPGANSMQMKDGRTIDLEYYDNRRDINVHDVAYVRRHILEDDWVIVNRAPTLHRGSTMGFKVKVIPNSFVINLHVSVFLPFNADCDGDELSVHIPQTIEARAEVMEIMAVKFHTMKDGGLWIKFSQNPVIGAFLLTHEDTFLTKDQVSVLLGHVTRFITIPPPAVWKPRQLWTGRQVMHCILPSSIHIHTVFTEKVLNGVLRDIIMYHSLDEAMDFLYEGYLITQEYLDMRGHSCSYHQMYWEDADSCPNYHKLQNMQEQPEDVVGQHIQFYTKSIQDRIEELVTARDRNTLHNGYLAMIQSGTKANWASLSQMMGVVGQAYLTHERIPNVTSHFHPHDKSLVAHGFIKHPYAMGLTFHDLMTQAQPTTESVINKIKGTSQSGYLEKKMAYCNMGIIADTFGHAVDSYSGNRRQHAFRKEDIHKPGPTVWFTYGGDSLDPQYLVWETITPPTLELWPNHHHHVFYRESWLLWDKIKDQDLTFKSPFHIKHLFQQATTYTSSPDLMETEIITSFTYIWQSMVKERLVPAQHHKLHVLLRVWCCPHNVLVVWKLSSVAWYKLLRLIYHTIQRRTILPGEAIGMNATHSVGEVYTQGNLKSPHSSGKKNTQVTGVNKLNNLIDANNSLAMMNIVFLPHVTEAEVHYTAMTWRTVYLSEILSDYPKIDESSMTIRLHIDPKLKAYYLVQDYNIILALHHTIQIPISAIHKVDKTLFCIRLTPSVGIWTFALRQIKCKVKNPTTHALYGVAYNIFHQTIVRGKLDGISKYIIEQQASNRWVCITDQSDFSIWNTHPLVDVQQSYSTHTGDTQKFMGVYATTQVLTHEFVLVMGDSTDARHLELMARYMTMTGIHEGYKKNEAAKRIAPMQQASFEESSRHVMENVDMGRWDPGNTIAAAAMCNKNMGLGSGYHFQMIQDVIPFRPKKLEFQPQRYVMVPYLNGIRGLLLFTTYKNCIQLFLMDQQKKTTKLKHMPSKLPIPLFAGTVLDGEMVQLNDQGFCFTIMDCYMMCGNPAKHLRYDQRWELAIQAIQMISKCPTASTTSISVSPCVVKSSLYPTLYNKVVHHPEIPFGLHVKPLVEMSHILKFTYMLPIEALDFMDTSSEALSSSSSSSSSYGSKVIPQLRLRSHRIYCTIQPFESIRELPWPDGTPSTVQYYRFYQGDYLLKSKDNVIISAAICPYPLPKNAVVACEYRDAQWIISGPSQSLPFTWKQVTDTIIAIAENISVNELLPFPVIQ
jgi:DNA-directed RNA polymerase beta' subunit